MISARRLYDDQELHESRTKRTLSEPNRLNGEMVKQFTGGDIIYARRYMMTMTNQGLNEH